MGKPRHRDQDHTERLGGDGAGSLVGFLCPCRAAVCIMLFILSILIYCLCSRLSTMQECGGCLPVPGPASSQAAHLPGQAAHRQGDRDGEDEEDGGFAAGAKPGRGREDSWCSVVSGWGGGGLVGPSMGIKSLGLVWGLGLSKAASGFCSANGNPGLNSPSLSRLPAHLPSGQHIHAGVNVLERLIFFQELRKETLTLS